MFGTKRNKKRNLVFSTSPKVTPKIIRKFPSETDSETNMNPIPKKDYKKEVTESDNE